jgi:hypothetical protein
MRYLKLFEDFNSRNPKQVAELLEDLFVEIFDKWEIKEIPIVDDSLFFANLETEDLYYDITTIKLGKGARIIFKIQQNIFNRTCFKRFKEMVRDCQPVLSRLKSFGVDFEWDSQMMQNPYNFGRLEYFRVIVNLNNINESMEESLIEELDEEKYRYWEKRVIGPPEPEIIPLIRDQIDKIEKRIANRNFDKDDEVYFGNTYEYHRRYSLSDNKPDLYVKIQKCDDDWYIVEIYSGWNFFRYLCDTKDGLKYISEQKLITY